VLTVHLCVAAFIVIGLAAIVSFRIHRWRWTRNLRFRALHLLAVGIVALESTLGIACPLTVWEDALRGTDPEQGFIQRWVHRLLFYDLPAWVFTTAYLAVAAATIAAWVMIPPQRAIGTVRR
jgi:hypothetical protein